MADAEEGEASQASISIPEDFKVLHRHKEKVHKITPYPSGGGLGDAKGFHKHEYDPRATDRLQFAVRFGDADEARIHLEDNADPNEFPVLMEAVGHRRTDVVKLLLEHGADPNKVEGFKKPRKFGYYSMCGYMDRLYRPVLSEAVRCEYLDMVKLLLEHGADPNKHGVLDYALSLNQEKVVDILLERGANSNTVPGYELRYAAMKGHLNTVKEQLEKGDVKMTGRELSGAASYGHKDIVKLLLDKGADPNEIGALSGATSHGHLDIVKLLLDKGADPNEHRALTNAANNGHTDIVKLLLDKGADPNENRTLSNAAENGRTDIVKLLVDNGANLNESGALSKAAANGHTDIVKLLLDKGADPNESPVLLEAVHIDNIKKFYVSPETVQSHNIDMVRLLLQKGADPNKFPVLQEAVRRRKTDMVKLLLKNGADPNKVDGFEKPRNFKYLFMFGYMGSNLQYSVLEQAVEYEDLDMVKLLFEHGADPNKSKALNRATEKGRTDIVTLLLDKGADPNKSDELSCAAKNHHMDILKLLLDKGADPYMSGALSEASENGNRDIVELLFDKGADPSQHGALSKAAKNGHTDIVKLLLDKRADPNQSSALLEAAKNGHTDIVKLLLDKGADPNQSGALPKAAEIGHTDIVKLLLDNGVDPNQPSALASAAYRGHTDVVKLLLDKGTYLDMSGALCMAAQKGYTDIVNLLLYKGADPNQASALASAAYYGYTNIVKLLLDKGTDPNESDILSYAARHGHTDIVKLLLDRGADPNQSDALFNATQGGHSEIVKLLLDKGVSPSQKIRQTFGRLPDRTEITSDSEHPSPMASNIKTIAKDEKRWLSDIARANDIEDFNLLEKEFASANRNEDSCASLLHLVAVNGTSDIVEHMQNFDGINWDEQHSVCRKTFGKALNTFTAEKATPLHIATFLDRIEVAESLVKYAGKDNIKCCFQTIKLSEKTEQIFMLELAKRLTQKHSDLTPAVIPGYQYKDGINRSRVLIVYSQNVLQASEYDFETLAQVMIRNPYVVTKTDNLNSNVEDDVREEDIKRTENAIKIHGQYLWKKHSNLNIITGSNRKYRRNGTDFDHVHCVVLYCSTKGVIPLGEEPFPRRLRIEMNDYIDVDVREGYFEYGYRSLPSTWPHPTLKMGCNIGRLTPQYDAQGALLPNLGGTLGPFVRYNNSLGFLTCAHVLFDIPSPTYRMDFTASVASSVEVVQPSTDAAAFHGGVACGVVERAIFDPKRDPSVDAAVVRLTDPAREPDKGQFSNELKSSFENAGFVQLPEYNNGDILTTTGVNGLASTQILVKFGSKTDVTKGALRVYRGSFRPLTTALGLPRDVGDIDMKNQYQVIGIYPSANFFEKGDSGSGVFFKDHNGVLHCIGMAIGSANVCDYQYRAGVVTPIEALLQALGPNISVATFP